MGVGGGGAAADIKPTGKPLGPIVGNGVIPNSPAGGMADPGGSKDNEEGSGIPDVGGLTAIIYSPSVKELPQPHDLVLGMSNLNVGENASSVQSRVAFDKYSAEMESIRTLGFIHTSPLTGRFSCSRARSTVNPLHPPPFTDIRNLSESPKISSIFWSAEGVMFMVHVDALDCLS